MDVEDHVQLYGLEELIKALSKALDLLPRQHYTTRDLHPRLAHCACESNQLHPLP
jgi:hypothetical protein